MLPRLWWDRWHIDQRSRFPREEIFPLMERWPNRTSNNSWALPKKHTAGQRFRLFCLLREIRGVLCFAPIGRPTCMTKRSSRSFCSALRSIRQSKNVNESCTEKDPDVAVRAIRVIWLAGRSSYDCSIILDNSATVGSLPFGVNPLTTPGRTCDSCLVRSSSERPVS